MARILQILVNAAALWVAVTIVPDLDFTGAEVWKFLLVAVIFSLVNTFIKPILKIISLPITAVTLGLFLLVINALMLQFSAALLPGIVVQGFLPAFWAALLLTVLGMIIRGVLRDTRRTQPD